MPIFLDPQSWKLQVQELAYKDPFSEDTHRIRRKAIFVSFVAVVTSYYPVDLQNSHVLGIVFSKGSAPPLQGLVGLLVVFFGIELLVYTAQELVSWVAQVKESYLSQLVTKLDEIAKRNSDFREVVTNTRTWLESVATQMADSPGIDSVESNGQTELAAIRQKLRNDSNAAGKWVCDLEKVAEQHKDRVTEATSYLKDVQTGVRRAIILQFLRVGLVQIVFPILIILWAMSKTLSATLALFRVAML